MKSKKFSIMLGIFFCALLVQAQDNSTDDAEWDSEPTDAAESQKAESSDMDLPDFEDAPSSTPGKVATPATEEVPPPLVETPPPPTIIDAPVPVPAPAPAPTIEAQPTAVMTPPAASPAEPPDYSKESRFHRIYKSFNEQPTSAESWEKAVGTRQSETYQVQKGDTLSGISTTLFGDQFFWPKIWSLNNEQILNPHQILPGMSVQFYPGSAEDAPTLQLGESAAGETEEVTASAPVVPPEAPLEVAGTAVAEPVKNAKMTLPPAKKTTPLLKVLPGSLPVHGNRIGMSSAALDVQIEKPATNFPTPLEYLGYYITEAPIVGAGVITGAEMGMTSAGEYQYVFVRLEGATGKEFVAQKNLTTIPDPQNHKRQGQMVEIQGEIEILEKVNSEKNIYRAIVRKAIELVEVGSVLTPGKLPMISANGGNTVSGVGAKIMGGQFDKKRHLFGTNSLVFLDSGTSQGLQEGQALSIYADERVRNKKTEALENDRVIGLLKVVRVTSNFATAYVVKASEDIQVGDYVGKVGAQARAAEPEFEDAPEPAAPTEKIDEDFEDGPASDEPAPDSGTEDSDLEL